MVNSVERLPTGPAGSQLILRCKDFRTFAILVPLERDCVDVHASLARLSRPGVRSVFIADQASSVCLEQMVLFLSWLLLSSFFREVRRAVLPVL